MSLPLLLTYVYIGVGLFFASISLRYFQKKHTQPGEEESNVQAAICVGFIWPAIPFCFVLAVLWVLFELTTLAWRSL